MSSQCTADSSDFRMNLCERFLLNFILLTHYVYLQGDPHREKMLGVDPGRRPTPTYVLALLLLERMPACFCMLTPNAGVLKTVSAHHARGLRLTFFRPKEIAMAYGLRLCHYRSDTYVRRTHVLSIVDVMCCSMMKLGVALAAACACARGLPG